MINPSGSNRFIEAKLKVKCFTDKALKSNVFKLLFIVFPSGFSVPCFHGSVVLLNAKESTLSNSPPRLFLSN